MTKLTGQCLCGACTFKTTGDVAFMANCHCTDCRKSTGAAYASFAFYLETDISRNGKTQSYSHPADSGNILTKHFCGNCGSPMYVSSANRTGMMGIRAGIINEADLFKPTVNVYAGSKMPSTPLDPRLPAPEKMPE